MKPDHFDELVRPFAEAIFALSRARSNDSLGLTGFQDARFREAIATLIRKACDVIYPAILVAEVSVAANAAAEDLGVDLHRETWQSQKKFDPGYKVFHYEHMLPVGAIVAIAAKADSIDSVVKMLRAELRLAWITKEENKALNALGFTTKRPNPDEAYRAAGIELIAAAAQDEPKDPSTKASRVSSLRHRRRRRPVCHPLQRHIRYRLLRSRECPNHRSLSGRTSRASWSSLLGTPSAPRS